MAVKASRAALYHRVSTVDQNPRAARKELRMAAKRHGLRIELDVEETGSGANNDRPGFKRVMDAARQRKIDAVLVWKLDRFGRSALDLLTNLRELESSGVRFVCVTQGIDIRPSALAKSGPPVLRRIDPETRSGSGTRSCATCGDDGRTRHGPDQHEADRGRERLATFRRRGRGGVVAGGRRVVRWRPRTSQAAGLAHRGVQGVAPR